MASIVKRKNKYSVVYRYTDEHGKEKQKWETFDTQAAAKKSLVLFFPIPSFPKFQAPGTGCVCNFSLT